MYSTGFCKRQEIQTTDWFILKTKLAMLSKCKYKTEKKKLTNEVILQDRAAPSELFWDTFANKLHLYNTHEGPNIQKTEVEGASK